MIFPIVDIFINHRENIELDFHNLKPEIQEISHKLKVIECVKLGKILSYTNYEINEDDIFLKYYATLTQIDLKDENMQLLERQKQLHEKEKQLHEIEKQLHEIEKLLQLRNEKIMLLEKEKQLRDESVRLVELGM